jgi:ADP-heptose:LPS heptosyltransferase
LTVDALAALRARFPEAEIELIGNAQAGAVLMESGIVQTVTSFDSSEVTGLYTVPPRLAPRWTSVDVAVLWLRQVDAVARSLREAGVPRVIAAEPPTPGGRRHAADDLVATLVPLGITQRPPFRPLIIGSESYRSAQPRSLRSALVHPGSGAAGKNWPPQRFAALIRRLIEDRWAVSLLSGPADADSVSRVVDELGNSAPPVVASPSVLDLARRLTRTALYVGNDSGVTHLSARLGVPTLAVFGPTDPGQWAPRGPRVGVVRGEPWPSVDAVYQELTRLMSGRSRRLRVTVRSRLDAPARLHSSRG